MSHARWRRHLDDGDTMMVTKGPGSSPSSVSPSSSSSVSRNSRAIAGSTPAKPSALLGLEPQGVLGVAPALGRPLAARRLTTPRRAFAGGEVVVAVRAVDLQLLGQIRAVIPAARPGPRPGHEVIVASRTLLEHHPRLLSSPLSTAPAHRPPPCLATQPQSPVVVVSLLRPAGWPTGPADSNGSGRSTRGSPHRSDQPARQASTWGRLHSTPSTSTDPWLHLTPTTPRHTAPRWPE